MRDGTSDSRIAIQDHPANSEVESETILKVRLLIPSPSHSIEVHLVWSEPDHRPPLSVEGRRGLLLRLQLWLQEQVGDVSGAVRYMTPDHEIIHTQWP